jgi:hypothetical protein
MDRGELAYIQALQIDRIEKIENQILRRNNNMKQPTQVVTGQVRLTFPHLFQKYANQPGQEPKYSVTMLLPKTDVATKANIDAAINAAIEMGISKSWNGQRPAKINLSIHDGDGVRPNGEQFGPECKGHWVFTASSKNAPEVVSYPSLEKILNESEIYSGVYALVSLNFFSYASSGNKGIGIGLNNVAKVADGEPLGGRTTAANDFAGVAAQPQQGYQAPSQYQQPAPQDSAWPNQLGGQPQQYQQPPQTYQAPPVQQGHQQAPQTYQQPAPQPQQGYQQPPQPAPQQIDPITGLPIGGVYGI